MKITTKIFGFIVVSLLLGLAAKTLPHKQVIVTPLNVEISPQTVTSIPAIDASLLLQRYQSRPLFVSKIAHDVGAGNETDIVIVKEWSPFDYQLIGISRVSSKTTGWFKNIDTGDLVSGRQGMQLGNWTLDAMSGTEAKLSSEGKTESLKLFQGGEAR